MMENWILCEEIPFKCGKPHSSVLEIVFDSVRFILALYVYPFTNVG